MPEAPAAAPRPPVEVKATPSIAQELAAATRARVEAARRYGAKHTQTMKAAGVEAALRTQARTLAARDKDYQSEIVAALSSELASAMALRSQASARYGARHPEMIEAETLVRDLTIAVNAEVRGRS
jgi:uncharacterized protein involved in exopolysaccharide biosynthesis